MSSEQQESKFKKSRHLSILDFFEKLQIEYIQADLRCKIYPKIKDKNYWARVKEFKKANIDKLAERNSIPSIFTDEYLLRLLQKQVYRETSYPLFTYRDDDHKLEQEYLDLQYYYNQGADVRVNDGDEIKVGKITIKFTPYKETHVIVNINGVDEKHHISKVTRIL